MSALNLFCLPHAQGSAAFYRRWSESLPAWIQVRPLELSGVDEPLGSVQPIDVGMLARQLADESIGAQPCALFGHGLGGLLAFELAHVLRMSSVAEPLALFVSGAAAPSRCDSGSECRIDTWLYECHDARLEERPGEASGSPADCQLLVGHGHEQRPALRSSIHVLGKKHGEIKVEALLEWQRETAGDFSLDMLEKHHFFIQQQEARVLRLVCRYCERHLRHWISGRQRAAG